MTNKGVRVEEAEHGAERFVDAGMTLRQALQALRAAAIEGPDYRAVGGIVYLSDGSVLHPGNRAVRGENAVLLGRYDATRYARDGRKLRHYRLK